MKCVWNNKTGIPLPLQLKDALPAEPELTAGETCRKADRKTKLAKPVRTMTIPANHFRLFGIR